MTRVSFRRVFSRCSCPGVALRNSLATGLAARAAAAAALLLLASAALIGCATPGSRANVVEEPALSVRVMSFNIAAGHGDLPRIAEVIRASGAEIVGLQEVDVHWGQRSGFMDQATWLAGELDMEIFFAPIYSLAPAEGRPHERQYGLAILSRHPISAATNHSLSRLSTQTDLALPVPHPGFPHAQIELGGRAVHVFNTHLDYRSDPATRRLQVREMLQIIGAQTQPVLLLGDLNAEPDAPELRPLFHTLNDVWRSADDGFTFPADSPIKRIDYILASRHFTVDAVEVLRTSASDHRPVIADLTLRSGN
jgi:endonuclease/exonuclease/phosphatase family metal-dependent hydrolase